MAWREVWDTVAASACGPSNGVPCAIVLERDGKIVAPGNPGDGRDVSVAVESALAKP